METEEISTEQSERREHYRNALVVAAAYVAAALLYKFAFASGFGHTSLVFVGIPGILAVLLALAPKAKSAKGSIVKGITFALLLLAPLLGEGYVCILMAAPLFYAVGLAIGAGIDYGNRKEQPLRVSFISVLLILMSMEGLVPALTHSRTETVTVERVIAAPVDRVQAALAQGPNVTTPLAGFLRIGFPRPQMAYGSGLELNATRTIHFSGAEGDPPGDLTVRVVESAPGHVVLNTVSDSSKLRQWVEWRSCDVTWNAVDATHTRVRWETTFARQLDPWWYFAPLERWAVRDATDFMLRANATPPELQVHQR